MKCFLTNSLTLWLALQLSVIGLLIQLVGSVPVPREEKPGRPLVDDGTHYRTCVCTDETDLTTRPYSGVLSPVVKTFVWEVTTTLVRVVLYVVVNGH